MSMADFVYNGCGHVGTQPPLHGATVAGREIEYCSLTCRTWYEPDYVEADDD